MQELSEVGGLSADAKLVADQINEILNERAKRFGHDAAGENENLIEMIVFTQASTQYAVPLEMLSEIRIISKITYLPLVSKSIMGVVNVRGRITAIYSLGEQKKMDSHSGYALIGHGEAGHIAIWAEDILGAESVLASDIRSTPISLSDKEYITGVGSNGMIYLDLEKFVKNNKLYIA